MRGLVATLEKHHSVRILDEAVERGGAAVGALHPGAPVAGQGGVSLLDTACARVGMSQAAMPAADRGPPAPHRADRHRARASSSARWPPATDHAARRERAAGGARDGWRSELAALEARWEQEKALAAEIARDCAARSRTAAEHRATRTRCAPKPDRARVAEAARRCRARTPLIYPGGRWPGGRRGGRELDRHPGRPDASQRDPHRAEPEGGDGAAHRRPAARAGGGRPGDPHRRAPG